MADALGLAQLVGSETFSRGLDYFHRDMVHEIFHAEASGEISGEVYGTGDSYYGTEVSYGLDDRGRLASFEGTCGCPVGYDCKHAVALLLAAIAEVEVRPPVAPRAPAEWERSLARLVDIEADATDSPEPLGLAFQLYAPIAPAAVGQYRTGQYRTGQYRTTGIPGRLGMRPVRLGQRGKWIRTGVSWADVGNAYAMSRFQADHVRLLRAISTSDPGTQAWRHGPNQPWIQLDSFRNPAVWEMLEEAAGANLHLMLDDNSQQEVRIAPVGANFDLQVSRGNGGGIALEPVISLDGTKCDRATTLLLGHPIHGVATWRSGPNSIVDVTLARFAHRVDPELCSIIDAGPIHIPAHDELHFMQTYLPALRQRHRLTIPDDSIRLPEHETPILSLQLEAMADHRMRLEWHWVYRQGELSRRIPLLPTASDRGRRDTSEEARVLKLVTEAAHGLDQLVEKSSSGPRLRPIASTEGGGTVDLMTRVLPALADLAEVEVHLLGLVPEYRESLDLPVVNLSSVAAPGTTDWFDLTVTVSVDGHHVPFDRLFCALATDQDVMILPDGTYFSLLLPELQQLRTLIEEARALGDKPGQLRISRFQVGLWEELEAIGIPDAQSRAWIDQVRAWRDVDDDVVDAVPDGLTGTLRNYQVDGFVWLNLLRRNGLGGILADDMGLGKTIQTLAMIAQARAEAPAAGPYLVVAPTSVLSNWKSEAARFVPHLRTAVISATECRRGSSLAESVRGADIVITSYTLLRLEIADHESIPYSGVVLDEAQAVKNHQSKVFGCVKRLPVPFKLAITGTPMENNLMELWSLFSVVAPGLFPHPGRFTDYYRTPIEKDGDTALLGRLRRRIRPLMLRRTKEQVVFDLPPKQEQVLEVELTPAHRRVYQRYLQRERQKVLGLLDDMDGNRFAIFRSLMLLRQASIDPALVDEQYADVDSTKMTVLLELLRDVISGGHRTLIFSQFTGFLHRIRDRLESEGIGYSYLDGSTRNRPAVLDNFRNGSDPVFLISLKAGGVGLNLTEADYCILTDPWWNPATEAQAVDRTHRIGQTKNVMVYRLVSKDTIEEKVMALKASKARLFTSVMAEDGVGGKAITAQDIRELLA